MLDIVPSSAIFPRAVTRHASGSSRAVSSSRQSYFVLFVTALMPKVTVASAQLPSEEGFVPLT